MNRKIPVVLALLIMLTGCSGSVTDLGVNNGQLLPCPKTPNCVHSQATDKKHYIPPLQFKGTQHEAQSLLLRILESEKRAKIRTVQSNYIRAEFTSAVFRFVDDVEFYFPAKQAEQLIIHIRSASRVGSSDLGVNRKRIEQIRKKINNPSKINE